MGLDRIGNAPLLNVGGAAQSARPAGQDEQYGMLDFVTDPRTVGTVLGGAAGTAFFASGISYFNKLGPSNETWIVGLANMPPQALALGLGAMVGGTALGFAAGYGVHLLTKD